jgi:hypothetical protein
MVISDSPLGAQSPVNRRNVNPASASARNRTGCELGTFSVQSLPSDPHSIPALNSVPPCGGVIVSS